jgi:DNA-binding CsgD family transcriptional regulator
MFTFHYWYFDKDNKLYYYNSFPESSSIDGYIRFAEILKENKRACSYQEKAVKVYTVCTLTAHMNVTPPAPPSNSHYCLACATLELTEAQTNIILVSRTMKTYQEIADKLGISVETVRTHFRDIYSTLQVKNQGEAHSKIEAQVKQIDSNTRDGFVESTT